MTTNLVRRTTKILVLNPNSSKSMTHGLEQGIRNMELSQVCLLDVSSLEV
jgi:Asp/Glu/hydantoin racemase